MPITYSKRKGITKTGKPRYSFSREKKKDEPVDEGPQEKELVISSLIDSRTYLLYYVRHES